MKLDKLCDILEDYLADFEEAYAEYSQNSGKVFTLKVYVRGEGTCKYRYSLDRIRLKNMFTFSLSFRNYS